ncbi:DUF1149 family protein [Streptococcus pluranimalium]|uniref:DUF1149 domain-containing protein n=1 Tax=Streptococcus pluranimalium TaxID=82348 RepID=A0A345VJ34_9STRE|nr:DUF1149 family protein [Streptococcus pluranimalium]AXJ12736.1 hypothetical protein Sp14A_08130 [Streptococcus pluranimalium]
MEVIREKEFVNQYHYNSRNLEWEKENGTPKTNFEVTFQLIEKNIEKNDTTIVAVLQFTIVRDEFVISGVISQMDHIKNRIVNEPKEFSQEEVESLAAPLLEMVRRMTYEVTEIALDRPGIKLEFNS